jgi:putative nucleotidyltransferase with HDIG domain
MAKGRIHYRFWQFISMSIASFRPVDIEYAKTKLPSTDLLELFMRMPRMEQNHGIAVCKALEEQGKSSSDLLTAALLHDAGKTKYFPRLWERVFTVLLKHSAPRLATKMSKGPVKGLRRGFVIQRHHASWGADLLQRSGASARTVHIVAMHHTSQGDDEEIVVLQSVDDG